MRHAQHQRRRSGVMMSNATYHTFACPAIVAKKMKTHRARQATTNPARQAVREGRSLSALKWYNTYTPLHLLRTFCFFFLFVFPLLIVLRVFLPCSIFVRFVLSSCCFPFVLYDLLRFWFRFPVFLDRGFGYSVISSRRCTPPALRANMTYACPPCVLSSFLCF